MSGEEVATPARWRRRIGRQLAAGDAVVIAVSTALSYYIRLQLGEAGVVGGLASEIPLAVGILPLWLTVLYWTGSYRPEILNSGGDAFRRFSAGVTAGVLALGFVSFLFQLAVSRLFVGFLFVLVYLFGGLLRLATRAWLRERYRRGELIQNVLVVGTDREARSVVTALRSSDLAGYRVIGFLDPDQPSRVESVDGLNVLGPPEQALDIAYKHRAGLVLVSPTGVPPGTLDELMVSLEGSPVDLAVAPSLFEVVSRRVTVETVANVPILHVDQIRLQQGSAILKRSLDVVVGALLGVLTSPFMLAASVAIRLDTPGPILFRQIRVGKEGEEFTLLKFRTMVEDADQLLRGVEHLNEVGHGFFKVREDPRVTRVGRLLRKWSIDELPQLWNVLKGEMSMVGPRPPLPREVETYESWQLRRLRVRPGITGVWQVSGRSTIPFEEAVRMDLFYIENWSLGMDLFLLAKTVLAVLGRSGAY